MRVFEPAPTRKSIAGQMVWFTGWLGVTAVGAILKPSPFGHGTHEQLGMPPCPSVLFFSRPCPGCGLTTSFTATIHGRFAEAFHAHPLGPILYLAFTLTAFAALLGYMRTQRFNMADRRLNAGLWTLVVAFVSFGVVRWFISPNYASPGEIPGFAARVIKR